MVVTDKRLDSYNLLMQKSEQQSPYHLIGPLNYHVQWLAFWAFAYIKLIPLKLHICWRTGMFDVANRCKLRHKKNFFSTTFLYRVSPPYLLATTTSQEPHPKFKRYFYDYFKTKQQEFIHPLILSPTLHERKKATKIQKNQICFPSCSSWPNDRNWPKNQSKKHTQKKLRKPNNR